VRRVLLLLPSLDYGGAARQATLLAAALPRGRFEARVCVLGGEAPWADELRRAGVAVETLGWRRPFDLAPFLALRRLLRAFRPQIVHAWGAAALRALTLVGGPRGARVIASAALPPQRRPPWPDRWLLRRAPLATAYTPGEAERLRRAGVAAERVVEAAPAAGAEFAPEGPTPADAPPGRLIVGVGPLAPHKGFRDAVWALDVLHYLYADLRLALVGDGPERDAVAAFARSVESGGRVHFTGPVADVAPWLRRAEVVWAPSRGAGGGVAVLEALAAGRPVVASRVPGPADLVEDGVSGYLVEPGDKAALARQTRFLLEDAGRRRQFGEAGRRKAQAYTVERMAETFAALYER
jgi:glycosyltransferase involved in cell wall biosynthesis